MTREHFTYEHIAILFRIVLIAAGICLLVTACGYRTGDFGRLERTIFNEYAYRDLPYTAGYADTGDRSTFRLTDNELEFRARAYRFFMDEHRHHFFARGYHAVVNAHAWPPSQYAIETERYYIVLRRQGDRSVVSHYRAIESSIVNDRVLIDPFLAQAREVYLDDRRRLEAIDRTYDASLNEIRQADLRVAENRRVAWWALIALEWRAASYGYALDRSRIELPSQEADRVEYELARLVAAIQTLRATLGLLEGSGRSGSVFGAPVDIGTPVSKH